MHTLDWYLTMNSHIDYFVLIIGNHEIVINIYEKGASTICETFKFVSARENIVTLNAMLVYNN